MGSQGEEGSSSEKTGDFTVCEHSLLVACVVDKLMMMMAWRATGIVCGEVNRGPIRQ